MLRAPGFEEKFAPVRELVIEAVLELPAFLAGDVVDGGAH